MKRAVRWLVVGGVCVAAGLLVVAARVVVAVLTSEPDAVFGDRVDAFGDPLPADAVARLGTVRLRSASSANLLFLDGGKLVVSAGMREEIVAWDTTTGARAWTLPGHRRRLYREPSHYRFRDLRRLVVHGEPSCRADEVMFLDASADGGTLVSSGRTISAWDVATRLEVGRARPPLGLFWCAAAADDGSIAYFDRSGLHVLDAVSGREWLFEPRESEQTESLFACSARAFATGSEDGTIVVRDRNTRVELGRVRTGDGSIRACALDDDGSRVWVSGFKGPIVCWSVASGERVGTWTQAGLAVSAIAVSGDGRWLATNVIEDRVRKVALWEGSDLRSTWSRFGYAMAFSPDGSLLAVRDWPTIRLFETATGKERAITDAHKLPVHALALSGDGALAASSSMDGTLRLWDTATSRVVRSVPVEASAVAFARDGRALVAATLDGEIVAWDVATGAERHRRSPTASSTVSSSRRMEPGLSSAAPRARSRSSASPMAERSSPRERWRRRQIAVHWRTRWPRPRTGRTRASHSDASSGFRGATDTGTRSRTRAAA